MKEQVCGWSLSVVLLGFSNLESTEGHGLSHAASGHAPVFRRAEPLPVVKTAAFMAPAVSSDDAISLAEITSLLSHFLQSVRSAFAALQTATKETIWAAYAREVAALLGPFEARFAGRHTAPRRADGSIFVSIAAYRDHMLGNTLRELFEQASDPSTAPSVSTHRYTIENSAVIGV